MRSVESFGCGWLADAHPNFTRHLDFRVFAEETGECSTLRVFNTESVEIVEFTSKRGKIMEGKIITIPSFYFIW